MLRFLGHTRTLRKTTQSNIANGLTVNLQQGESFLCFLYFGRQVLLSGHLVCIHQIGPYPLLRSVGGVARTSMVKFFVSEGVSAVLNWGFEALKVRLIYADVDEENTRSWRICERPDMKFEGLMRNARSSSDGQLRNCRLYASIR